MELDTDSKQTISFYSKQALDRVDLFLLLVESVQLISNDCSNASFNKCKARFAAYKLSIFTKEKSDA